MSLWKKIDESHSLRYILEEDYCIYAREYKPRQGDKAGKANQRQGDKPRQGDKVWEANQRQGDKPRQGDRLGRLTSGKEIRLGRLTSGKEINPGKEIRFGRLTS